MFAPRPYQTKAINAIESADADGVKRPLVVHPTGAGKCVTAVHVIKNRADRGRGLFLVHREELANQALEKLGFIAPELEAGLVKGQEANDVHARVVVASVPTVQGDKRLAELIASQQTSGPFGTVIADEAHHAPSPSWTKVLTGLGSFSPYGPLTIGFTATPERHQSALGVWEKVVAFMSIREAIYGGPGEEGGYLVPIPPAIVVETKMDMRRVRKTGRDYQDGDLGRALEESGAIQQMADAVLENASDRKGIAFLPTVKTSAMLAEELRKRGITAEHLDGTTEKDDRKAILARLRSGETQVVTNCAVLTEGFDEPSISFILIGRPTTSHGLYVQMVGRGTRKFPGKKDLMLIDIVGASNRHELIGWVNLDLEDEKGKRKRKDGESQPLPCPSCQSPDCEFPDAHRCGLCHRWLPARRVLDGETRHENCKAGRAGHVDVFGTSRMRWLTLPGGAFCLSAGQDVVVMAPAGVGTWRLVNYSGGKLEPLHEELPADWAMNIGEDRAKAFTKLVERQAGWLRREPTQPQLNRLVREGLPESALPRVKTRGEAADLLTRISGKRAARKMGLFG